ncbi:MAG: DUF4369 domain-containing protein [Ferruginibacter sp.]
MKSLFKRIAKKPLIASVICMTAAASNAQNYIINAAIEGLPNDSKIYLIRASDGRKIDSTISKNTRFNLVGHIHEAAHTYLYFGKTVKLTDILLDNQEINVTGNAPTYDSVTVSGSAIDAQWKDWFREDHNLGSIRYKINQLAKELPDNSGEKLTLLAAEIMKRRVQLLKDYVKRYNNSPSGAVLPTLCTIGDYLTKEDYRQMYLTLTPRMKGTDMGKMVKQLGERD